MTKKKENRIGETLRPGLFIVTAESEFEELWPEFLDPEKQLWISFFPLKRAL